MTNLKQLWQTSLLFRRITSAFVLLFATLLVFFGSHIRRAVSLPADDLNLRTKALLGEEQFVLRKPDVAEGDLLLSYVGNKNEIADIWLASATLDPGSQHLLMPGSANQEPVPISYTTGVSGPDKSKVDDTCHTTIEIRRVAGSAPVEALTLYQSDQTAGAQRFRQVVLDAGKTATEIEVHTDPPAPGATDLPGCHKLVTVGGNPPIEIPPIPIRIQVPGGKIDLHFTSANPALPIWTGPDQTFEAVSLGDTGLRGSGLQILSMRNPNGRPKLDVQGHPAKSLISVAHLKLGANMLRLDIGRDPEKAVAYADGKSLYNFDLVDAIQKNPILSFAFAAVLVPGLWKWIRKNCFPNMKE